MEKISFLWGGVGLTLASFIIVLARYPRTIFLRSHCSQCLQTLKWYDLIPVLSYLFLKGHCRTCSHIIPWWMPLIEVTGGLGFALTPLYPQPFLWCCLVVIMIALAVHDLEHGLISPLLLILLGSLCLFYAPLYPLSAFMVTIGLLVIQLAFMLYQKRLIMGMGDVQLLAIVGFYIDPFDLPLFISSLGTMGILWGALSQRRQFPFAPSIALVFLTYMFIKGVLS